MLKWWRVPPYPDWINAENTIIWLVTFQIQISNSNFQNFKFKTNFCVCRFLLQNVFLKAVNIFVIIVFILVDAFSCSIKTEKSQKIFLPEQEIILVKETFVHPLELWRNFIFGSEMDSPGQAVSLHLARPGSQSEQRIRRILPARWACHIIKKGNDHFSFKVLFLFIDLSKPLFHS